MWGITFRDLQFRRRQFALAVIGSALVFAIALILTGMSAGFRVEARHAVDNIGGDAWIVAAGVPGPFTAFSAMPAEHAEAVAQEPGVRNAAAIAIFAGAVAQQSGPKGVNIVGHPI